MISKKVGIFITILGCFILIVHGQILNPTKRYCFNFSWLGPKYTNESTFDNATCDDVTQMSNNVPCKTPLVITEDGTEPNMTFLWQNYDAVTSCLLVESEVCAKYIYRFNGFVENITYMCTKLITDGDRSINSGCFKSKQGNRETEVCACRSSIGIDYLPCNSAHSGYNITPILLFPIMIFLYHLITIKHIRIS